ncbi:hypothetical protein MTR_0329s0010 [Medicago truncatula]|uniref:Uncharacterized protein n=1 Tax=Medicago truncatula TaxID=3880 RepID=A0A072TEV9_MEDTR|nr:hypothetical protein MTR_0329s0010 [Medicago truncatula]
MHHTRDDTIPTLHGDIEATKRSFLQPKKSQSSVSFPKNPSKGKEKGTVGSIIEANSVEIDSRFRKSELKELKKKDPLEKEILRHMPNACLRENAYIFTWSAANIPGIDPCVACHQRTLSPTASDVAQQRKKQYPENDIGSNCSFYTPSSRGRCPVHLVFAFSNYF